MWSPLFVLKKSTEIMLKNGHFGPDNHGHFGLGLENWIVLGVLELKFRSWTLP